MLPLKFTSNINDPINSSEDLIFNHKLLLEFKPEDWLDLDLLEAGKSLTNPEYTQLVEVYQDFKSKYLLLKSKRKDLDYKDKLLLLKYVINIALRVGAATESAEYGLSTLYLAYRLHLEELADMKLKYQWKIFNLLSTYTFYKIPEGDLSKVKLPEDSSSYYTFGLEEDTIVLKTRTSLINIALIESILKEFTSFKDLNSVVDKLLDAISSEASSVFAPLVKNKALTFLEFKQHFAGNFDTVGKTLYTHNIRKKYKEAFITLERYVAARKQVLTSIMKATNDSYVLLTSRKSKKPNIPWVPDTEIYVRDSDINIAYEGYVTLNITPEGQLKSVNIIDLQIKPTATNLEFDISDIKTKIVKNLLKDYFITKENQDY